MHRSRWSLVATLALCVCLACGSGGAKTAGQPSPGPSVGTQTAATSSPSGDLAVYAALTQENGDALAKAFSTAYPAVHVTMVTGGTGALVTRITSEQKSGGVRADVIFLADPTAMDALGAGGTLSDAGGDASHTLPPGMSGKGWVGVLTFQNVIAYRTGIASPPADWTDLTNPSLKGKVVIADPSYSGTTFAEAGTLSAKYGWKYFQDLKANNARVEQSTNTVGTDIAQGMDDAGITLDSVVRDLVSKGAPLKIVWPVSGTVPVPAPVGITTNAKNTGAAQAFVAWLLSPAGQKEIVTLGYVPVVPGTEASNLIPAGTKQLTVDWSALGTQKEAILKQFHDIFGG